MLCVVVSTWLWLQVFVGRIPRELFEDVLVPVFEKAGRIWDFRLMIDSLSGYNRGYAFCTYCSKEGAKNAVKDVSTATSVYI